jgi:N-acyl-D-aspartate/D-glutamate deacylase
VELNSGLDGNPPLPGTWSTVEQYLSMFTGHVAVNVGYVLGNSPLRICAMGWDERPASAVVVDKGHHTGMMAGCGLRRGHAST